MQEWGKGQSSDPAFHSAGWPDLSTDRSTPGERRLQPTVAAFRLQERSLALEIALRIEGCHRWRMTLHHLDELTRGAGKAEGGP